MHCPEFNFRTNELSFQHFITFFLKLSAFICRYVLIEMSRNVPFLALSCIKLLIGPERPEYLFCRYLLAAPEAVVPRPVGSALTTTTQHNKIRYQKVSSCLRSHYLTQQHGALSSEVKQALTSLTMLTLKYLSAVLIKYLSSYRFKGVSVLCCSRGCQH